MNRGSKKIALAIATIALILISGGQTLAQTASEPDLILTWKADSYVPSFYDGKIFSARNSKIRINLEALFNNKIFDLSDYKISWHINDRFFKAGIGLKTVEITADSGIYSEYKVRATINNYNGKNIFKTIVVPLVSPRTVIDLPYSLDELYNKTVNLTAWPYFFNITNPNQLSYSWQAGPSQAASQKSSLEFKLEGSLSDFDYLLIRLATRNKTNPLETSQTLKNIR